MPAQLYRYTFANEIAMEDVESSLVLALLAAESLHGATEVSLQKPYYLDIDSRTCVIDAGSEAGRDLNRIFAGYLQREFGSNQLKVEHVGGAARLA